jgi:hypothetical protein
MVAITFMGRDASVDSETRREIGDVKNTDGGAVDALKQRNKNHRHSKCRWVGRHTSKNRGGHGLIVNRIHEEFYQGIVLKEKKKRYCSDTKLRKVYEIEFLSIIKGSINESAVILGCL